VDGGKANKPLGGLMPPSPFAATRLFPLPLKGAREAWPAAVGGLGEVVGMIIFNLHQRSA
jgi:hypothetical protein